MSTGIIYLAKNTISNKCYVGQTIRTLEQRKKEHLTQTLKDGFKFGRALRKYPLDSWEWTILIEVDTADLDENEQFFIADLDSFKHGYNSNAGGNWLNESNPRYDSTIYELWHPEHGIIKETVSQLCKRHNSFSKHFYLLVKGERQHINGYVLLENKDRYDLILNLHEFYHPDYGIIKCTPQELNKKYKQLTGNTTFFHQLTSGKVLLYHGWCLAIHKANYDNLVNKSKIITLIHPEHGSKTLRIKEFKAKYGLTDSGISNLISGKITSSKGWTFIKSKNIKCFKTLLEQYIELKEVNEDVDLIKQYELEHPIFKEAYDKLGAKGINSCKFVEDNIKEKLYATDVSKSKELKNIILDRFSTNTFYSLKDVKVELQNIYNLLSIKSKAKTTDLEVHFHVEYIKKKIESKTVKGLIIK